MEDWRPDAHKTLQVLSNEWSRCQACELGVERARVHGSFVFGEGPTGGVMFVGEGPGKTEEEQARPFVGDSGDFLRRFLNEQLNLRGYYITNVVGCRSWEYQYDSEGRPMTDRKSGEYARRDSKPQPSHAMACRQRLMEEIYLVDPSLIVALGATAAEVILRKPIAINTQKGTLHTAEVPGAMFIPQLTPKGNWGRMVGPKNDRQLVWPYAQNTVKYPLVVLYHPAYVLTHQDDQRPGVAPLDSFVKGMQWVYDIYTRYQHEVHGEALIERIEDGETADPCTGFQPDP